METAERLIGEQGLEGVSLRQIRQAAGQRNSYAVQYHFGDLTGLLHAIQRKRLPEVELKRAELLALAEEQGRLTSSRALMDLLYLPLIEHRGRTGERDHARFVLAMLSSPEGLKAGLKPFDAMPVARHVLHLLQAANPHLSMALLLERQRLLAIMVLTSVFNRRSVCDADRDRAMIDDVLGMATAALTAPVDPANAALIGQDAG